MNDEYIYLWAQWGILNHQRYDLLLRKFETLEEAWKKITPNILLQLGMRKATIDNAFEVRNRISFEQIMDSMRDFKVKLCCIDDSDYPENLKQLKNAPPFFVCSG